jgi:predicted RNA-binding Zn-ribbon protein involved in translation (DUF1610 family)
MRQALEALKGYRRELSDHQPCDAERALESALAELALEDAALCTALGWPGGISDPVLDRTSLLRRVAALARQQGVELQAYQLRCWCEDCDIKVHGGLRTKMSVCPECGDKRCRRAAHHDFPCSKRVADPLERSVGLPGSPLHAGLGVVDKRTG